MRLILLRHAKTEKAEAGQRDHTRRLNARGRDDAPMIGDQNPGEVPATGGSGDDELRGEAGNDDMHGDHWSDITFEDSGDGTDDCDGAAGIDTAAFCEFVAGVP